MLIIDPIDYSISIDRGDDQELEVQVVDNNGQPLNVSAGSFLLTVKSSTDDPISSAIFQLANPLANGIDIAQAASGIVVPNFPSLYIQSMAGDYVYDLQMTLSGKRRTLLPADGRGAALFKVPKNVTTPGVPPPAPGPLVVPFNAISLRTEYWQDVVTGLYWKKYFSNGQELTDGPSASIPF